MKQFTFTLALIGGLALVGGVPAHAASDAGMRHGSAMSHAGVGHNPMAHGMKHHTIMRHNAMDHGGKTRLDVAWTRRF